MIAEKVSGVAMYGGTASTILVWGLRLPDVAAMVSVLVALIGLGLNVWATLRRDRREARAEKERGLVTTKTDAAAS